MSRRRKQSSRTEGHHGTNESDPGSAGGCCGGAESQPDGAPKELSAGGDSGISGTVRIVLFGAIVIAVVAAAAFVLVDRLQGPATLNETAIQVSADMGGFDPGDLTVPAGETVQIEFASLDTPYHNDGGGWHQFAIPELGIDWQVGPQSSQVFSFQAPAQPGSYDFYCDICCGGKENPNMQGTLTVTV